MLTVDTEHPEDRVRVGKKGREKINHLLGERNQLRAKNRRLREALEALMQFNLTNGRKPDAWDKPLFAAVKLARAALNQNEE